MKKHLFYTFLAIFSATALVTLLGVTNVFNISDNYLKYLVTAFLVELAGALVAVFWKTEFFKDEDDEKKHLDELARLKIVNDGLTQQLVTAKALISTNDEAITKLIKENKTCAEQLERTRSLRTQIFGVLEVESCTRNEILRELNIVSDTQDGILAMAVIGELVLEKKIERDTSRGGSYYRIRKS